MGMCWRCWPPGLQLRSEGLPCAAARLCAGGRVRAAMMLVMLSMQFEGRGPADQA